MKFRTLLIVAMLSLLVFAGTAASQANAETECSESANNPSPSEDAVGYDRDGDGTCDEWTIYSQQTCQADPGTPPGWTGTDEDGDGHCDGYMAPAGQQEVPSEVEVPPNAQPTLPPVPPTAPVATTVPTQVTQLPAAAPETTLDTATLTVSSTKRTSLLPATAVLVVLLTSLTVWRLRHRNG